MTSEEIASLRALDAAAKRPPWTAEGAYVFPGDPDQVEGEAVWIFGTDDCGHPPTAALIIAMRNSLKKLLDEREALLKAARAIYPEDAPVRTGAWEVRALADAIAKAEAP